MKKYLYPHPDNPLKLVSRQRVHQLRKKAKGICVVCTKKAVTAQHCRFHAKADSKYTLARQKRKRLREAEPNRGGVQ